MLPTVTVAMTISVAVSISDTVPPLMLATHALVQSGRAATPRWPTPTGMLPRTTNTTEKASRRKEYPTSRATAMTWMQYRLGSFVALIVVLLACPIARAGGESPGWKPDEAGKYLDEREKVWFAFPSANRGQGATQTTCVSCHSVLGYALVRPVLRKLVGAGTPTEQERQLLGQTRKRVANWKKLHTAAFGLFYDFSDRKKQESWGTEAVLDAVILAFDDRYQGRSSPSAVTKQAFSNLWGTQLQAGEHQGTWDWLDFNMGPWEAREAGYFGAALAAIAVGTAPGYYTPGTDAGTDASVKLLQGYLKDGLPRQNLHNRAWGLWAATRVEGILTQAERRELVEQLLDRQQEDGGWSLPSLGGWVRSDGTAQEAASDGYATGLVLHVLQTAGVTKDDAKVGKGLGWLKHNQSATGAWRGVSVNKRRDPASHAGKFMSDAATAYAVLALSH
jgi:squalene-hopene/tetraprenyl-beta-curcumene cyclase